MTSETDFGGDSPPHSIAIITATFNSEAKLPRLIDSLTSQTDKDFIWIVQDGGSTDRTASLISEAQKAGLSVSFISEPDFGIYDALNRAICRSSAEYYLTVGSDDWLDPEAIESYRFAAQATRSPFVVADIRAGNGILSPRGGSLFLNKQFAFIAGHSVGTLVARRMHNKYGLYSHKFPIAADQLFLQKAYLSGECFYEAKFTAGSFGQDGISSSDVLGALSESMRIQIELLGKPVLNLGLFVIRFFKHFARIK